MSERYLGEVFDIHGGGLDLIFPHHENEIAQSRCAHGTKVMANVWMHNGFLQVEGRKMSKSEGNFVTIYELLHTEKFGGRQWPGEVLRLAMLMTHYREPIDFSVKRLEEAERLLAKWPAADAGDAEPDADRARARWPTTSTRWRRCRRCMRSPSPDDHCASSPPVPPCSACCRRRQKSTRRWPLKSIRG